MSGGPGGAGLSRRTVLRGAGGVAFVGASLAALKLPFFSVSGAQQDPSTCYAKDVSATDKQFIISNWPAYIDPIHKAGSTVSVFEKQTGITVHYTDDVNDNAEFYAKVKNQLASCQSIKRDMMVLTDWMAARMIGLGWIQPLDHSQDAQLHQEPHPAAARQALGPRQNAPRPVAERSDRDRLQRRQDRGGQELHRAPDPLRPQGQDHPAHRDARHDGLHAAARSTRPRRTSPRTSGRTPSSAARLRLRRQVRSFNGNDYLNDLASGNTLACEAWSGDVIIAQQDNPNIKFVAPEEGMSLWADNMLVPNLATHQSNAEEWINYYYDPKVAAQARRLELLHLPGPGCPGGDAQARQARCQEPADLPRPTRCSRATWGFMALDDQQEIQYERDWADVTSG